MHGFNGIVDSFTGIENEIASVNSVCPSPSAIKRERSLKDCLEKYFFHEFDSISTRIDDFEAKKESILFPWIDLISPFARRGSDAVYLRVKIHSTETID